MYPPPGDRRQVVKLVEKAVSGKPLQRPQREARRQDVKQEAADELDRIEVHDLDAVVVFRVSPAKAHLAVNKIEEAAVGWRRGGYTGPSTSAHARVRRRVAWHRPPASGNAAAATGSGTDLAPPSC
jgi:hypothetical protein